MLQQPTGVDLTSTSHSRQPTPDTNVRQGQVIYVFTQKILRALPHRWNTSSNNQQTHQPVTHTTRGRQVLNTRSYQQP